MFTLIEENRCHAVIKVFGVGGGGGNAINTMIEEGLSGVEFIVANTDAQALSKNLAPLKIQMGARLTKGLGAGANPDIGREAALEDRDLLREALSGADMVFLTAGLGGGTGTGAGPIVAEVAREVGALSVAVVTRPFSFEGATRRRQAEIGVKDLRSLVDTIIVIPNEKLLLIAGKEMRFVEAFRKVDEVLFQAVRSISELVTKPGYINLDFADVKAIMAGMGVALMGTGCASGQNRAVAAAEKAISSPLLEDVSIRGARGVLINITAGPSLSLSEVNEAASLVREEADDDANIIFGTVIDEGLGEEFKVTVIATGFESGVAESFWKGPRRTIKLVGKEDLEKPTFLRAAAQKPPERIEDLPVIDKESESEALEEFEIPTFLRRRGE
ncbi:MAG: cell division protein FtsZ [Deltaproteobacteria bacterium RBG_16_64_85]|nr:MAG: cell division protein FtsZ [Deltaproteobacteria bacterium RBG_16_64_85]